MNIDGLPTRRQTSSVVDMGIVDMDGPPTAGARSGVGLIDVRHFFTQVPLAAVAPVLKMQLESPNLNSRQAGT